MGSLTRLAHNTLAGAALLMLGSCALLPPFTPDLSARAPVLDGFGQTEAEVSTRVDGARQAFRRGLLQAYAFNEVEAVRSFKAALALDPACALCAWGVAWQLGPNINNTRRGDLSDALHHIGHALRHAAGASARERALIDAMALRYAHASQARASAPLMAEVCGRSDANDERAHPLDIAYAERMHELADRYPDDPDLLSLYAEAEMVATRSTWWSAQGQPGGRIGEVADRVERLLLRHTEHTGLNHYMIHVADALPVARRALAAADRLGRLAPRSPHLVHMPSHIYVRVGRYADAARVNRQAVTADRALVDTLKAQGFDASKDWRGHNLHFLWFAALMEGRDDEALRVARERAQRAAKGEGAYAEYLRSLPLLTLLRLERWPAVLTEPRPEGKAGVAQAFADHAQGIAQARSGQVEAAQQTLARLQAHADSVRQRHRSSQWMDKTVRAVLDVTVGGLQAELAMAQQRPADALEQQARVVAAAQWLDDTEPPMLASGSRLALGRMQASAGRWADAEASFRQDLAVNPGSGWALRGLVRVLDAQGRQAEAAQARADLELSWAHASPALRAAR